MLYYAWVSIDLFKTRVFPSKDNLATNCLSVFDHFVKLALKGLNNMRENTCQRKPVFQHILSSVYLFVFSLFFSVWVQLVIL